MRFDEMCEFLQCGHPTRFRRDDHFANAGTGVLGPPLFPVVTSAQPNKTRRSSAISALEPPELLHILLHIGAVGRAGV
jgi:hypothetical protein